MRALRLLIFTTVLGLAFLVSGWWGPIALGTAYPVIRRGKKNVVIETALCTMAACTILLFWQMMHPSYPQLAQAIGSAFPVPVWMIAVISVLFFGISAGAAAAIYKD